MGEKGIKWLPPGKNCGLCGLKTCSLFAALVEAGIKNPKDCPYYLEAKSPKEKNLPEYIEHEALFPERDVLGKEFDFILHPLPGEISARKIILPFRSNLVDTRKIVPGDIVMGRPMGAGCPIPHVLKVIKAEPLTGLLHTWVVGPKYSREGKVKIKDLSAYHMVGFEGIARNIKREPTFGMRQRFLPGFCMMTLSHTGIINMILVKKSGLHVRIEDIRIM
ncbi:MAG: Fe-s cluster, putative [Clostridia bacterium 41_269]|nr:MAG: Fe-s cluster, putative [Clostridia bacterium 41_269]